VEGKNATTLSGKNKNQTSYKTNNNNNDNNENIRHACVYYYCIGGYRCGNDRIAISRRRRR